MHVIERGSAGGRPLVLLHGVGTGARGWTPQLEALSDMRQVLAPDLPGFGGSSGPFTIDGAVEQLRVELERRGVERIDLGGLSLGALVALAYAAAWPEQVASLTVCAGFARLPPELQEMQSGMVAALEGMPPEAFASVIVDMTRPCRNRTAPTRKPTSLRSHTSLLQPSCAKQARSICCRTSRRCACRRSSCTASTTP